MKNMGITSESIVSSPNTDIQEKQKGETTRENNGSTKGQQILLESKRKRYARIDITIKTTSSDTTPKNNGNNSDEKGKTDEQKQNDVNNNGGVSYIGYNPTNETDIVKA